MEGKRGRVGVGKGEREGGRIGSEFREEEKGRLTGLRKRRKI